MSCFDSANWIVLQAEERQRLEAENAAMVTDEVERMKIEVEHEKAEIKVYILQWERPYCRVMFGNMLRQ